MSSFGTILAAHAHLRPGKKVDSPYNYIPTESTAIIFVVLFGLSTALHTGQAVYYRMWWLLPTACLAGFLEILGWSGRLWSSLNPALISPFQMQITATILGPTPLLAANFVILAIIIRRLGMVYSRLSPKWYAIIFCTCDVGSLVVQGVGGGIASGAASNNKNARPGANIMLGGIAFQLATITIFAICAAEFFTRYFKNAPIRSGDSHSTRGSFTKPLQLMSIAMAFNTTCLFIRAVYRVIELAGGWDGRVISTQVYFNVLDGAMVTLAIYTINFAHPGLLLSSSKKGHDQADPTLENKPTYSHSSTLA